MTSASAAGPGSDVESGMDAMHCAAVAIGWATAVSGLGLIAAPSLVLRILGAGRAEPTPFLFRIIGMFMAVSGGLLADGARPRSPARADAGRVALRWAMVAKIGAAIAVGYGVRSKRFGKQGLALAAFDASAAALIGAVMLTDR
jgi:hypothetical protein